jgi:hypothetical protein
MKRSMRLDAEQQDANTCLDLVFATCQNYIPEIMMHCLLKMQCKAANIGDRIILKIDPNFSGLAKEISSV